MRPQADSRFVVLTHQDAQGIHYDLMIDLGEALATWKLAESPEHALAAPLSCQRIADHRRQYLDYEGPISGDRGHVHRHDLGTCAIHAREPDRWQVTFQGQRLTGRFDLLESGQDDGLWCLRSTPS